MSNLLDYLSWRGDLRLTESGFNSVDNLILSVLAYADLGGIVPEQGSIRLEDAATRYRTEGRDQSHQACDPRAALEAAAVSNRFRNTRLSDYVNQVDPERQVQFAAISYTLDDGSVYVAFRGTDNSIVGWREDFNMGYIQETPGQSAAVDYLKRAAQDTDAPLMVGGHSKGGNFAVYASVRCGRDVQQRICRIYNNDGPGFFGNFIATEEYQQILDRLYPILPESSLIGMLLSSGKEGQIVRSSASGFQQHNPYTWQVLGSDFETLESRSGTSIFMDEALDRWIDGMSEKQREHFVSAVFDSLQASGASTLSELNANRKVTYNAVLKAAAGLDSETQKDFFRAMKSLAATGTVLLKNEAKKALERWNEERRSTGEGKIESDESPRET